MKKLWLCACGALVVLALSSCAAAGDEDGNLATDDSFVLRIVDQATDEVYGIQMDYYLQDALQGSFSVVHADGSPIAAGETLDQDFRIGDFPADADRGGRAEEQGHPDRIRQSQGRLGPAVDG